MFMRVPQLTVLLCVVFALVWLTSACLLVESEVTTPVNLRIESLPLPEDTPIGNETERQVWPGIYDYSDVMAGICFEAAEDARGRTFIFRNAEEHILFYDLADNSRLCRRAVQRYPFDFGTGRALVAAWSGGRGCTAGHEIVNVDRSEPDELIITVRFYTDGDCQYDLIRPLGLAVEGGATLRHIELIFQTE